MRWIALLFLLACGDEFIVVGSDASPSDAATDVQVDAPQVDAALDVGAEDDAGLDASDSGSDSAFDGGVDAGDVCPGAIWDEPLGICIHRFRYESGALCPGFEQLEWNTVEDQRRLEDLLRPLGSGGTGLRRSLSGVWAFPSGSSPDRIEWAPSQPFGSEQSTYFSSDGLRSFHRAYGWQFCTRPPL